MSCHRTPDREVCPLCGEPGRVVDRSETLKCPPEDCPEPVLPDFLMPVYSSHSQLGTDQGGKPTLAEQLLWFEVYGVTDPGERRLWIALWQVVTAAKLTETQRRLDRAGKDAES